MTVQNLVNVLQFIDFTVTSIHCPSQSQT